MRDFRDAKAMARTLRSALAAKGFQITVGQSLELIAEAFGSTDWNTLAAAIRLAETGRREPATLTAESTARGPRPEFSKELERTLHRAVSLAAQHRHEKAMLEHLLLALTEDSDASAAMGACGGDPQALKSRLASYLTHELPPDLRKAEAPSPSAGFQRVVQRAVLHVQTSGRTSVGGTELLVAIFSEEESQAAKFLAEQALGRIDLVKFLMAHTGPRGGDVNA